MCNGCSRNGRNNGNAATSAICCNPENPFYSDKRVCCDCDDECCGCFKESTRDCFWPDFSHPTWLCCNILYSCPEPETCESNFENPIDPEDRFVDGICEGCKKHRR